MDLEELKRKLAEAEVRNAALNIRVAEVEDQREYMVNLVIRAAVKRHGHPMKRGSI